MNEQIDLDAYSLALLDQLMRDSRQTVQQLADAVGLSPSPCWKRIKDMEAAGVIRGYTARVDAERVGLGLRVVVEANLAQHSEDKVRQFEQAVLAVPQIVQCHSTTGESDYVMTVLVADIKRFEQFLHDTLLRITLPGITHVRSRIVLRHWELKAESRLPLPRADVTQHLRPAADGRLGVYSARSDHAAAHIPGATYIDLQQELSDSGSPLRFTLPPVPQLESAFSAAGLSPGDDCVLYSSTSPMWATRVWWMLKSLGFAARVLDGGLPKWLAEGRPVTSLPARYPPGDFRARPAPGLWADRHEVLRAVGDGSVCTLNALTAAMHAGTVANARRRLPLPRHHPAAPTWRWRCAPPPPRPGRRRVQPLQRRTARRQSGRFLLNPRGLLWREVQADDIVLVDTHGNVLAGRHAVEPTAMFIHAAIHRIAGQACVLHTHMPYMHRADADHRPRAGHHAVAERDALPRPRGGRRALQRPGAGRGRGRAHRARDGAPTSSSWATTAWWSAAAHDHAYDDLYYLERACQVQVLAPVHRPAAAAGGRRAGAARGARRWASGCSPSCSSRRCGARSEGLRMCRNIRTLFNFAPPGHRAGGARRGAAVRAQAQRLQRAVARQRSRLRAGGGRGDGGCAAPDRQPGHART
jgi:Lrp/AsnC family leucine-responsive transcriptional regulator